MDIFTHLFVLMFLLSKSSDARRKSVKKIIFDDLRIGLTRLTRLTRDACNSERRRKVTRSFNDVQSPRHSRREGSSRYHKEIRMDRYFFLHATGFICYDISMDSCKLRRELRPGRYIDSRLPEAVDRLHVSGVFQLIASFELFLEKKRERERERERIAKSLLPLSLLILCNR